METQRNRYPAAPMAVDLPKKMLAACCLSSLLLLSGCSEAEALQRAGILEDADYLQYTELRETDQLDADGVYIFADEVETEPAPAVPEGSIHVTFAVNSYLNIQYYYDEALTKAIDPASCYVEPGGCIYAQTPECASPFGELYQFKGFRIYEYDANGSRGAELAWGGDIPQLVLKVPEDYSGSNLSVEPYGQYSKCTLALQDYYMDSSDQPQEAGGVWFINGEEVRGDQIEISPAASYSVDYAYDTDKYEFAASEPRNFSHEGGLVQFETAQAGSQVDAYSVRLQPLGREVPLKIAVQESAKDIYFQLTMSGSKQEDLRYDSGAKTSIRPDWMGGTDRLVYDQNIRMGSEMTLTAESGTLLKNYALRLDIVRTDTDGREHTEVAYIASLPGQQKISVYEDSASEISTVVYQEIRITVSKVEVTTYAPVSVPNAAIEVRLTDVSDPAALAADDVLEGGRTVEVVMMPDAEYYVAGSDVHDDVYRATMRYSKWVSDAAKIIAKHPVKKIRKITLDASDSYGTCIYKLDGEIVSGAVDVREEQKLVLEYTITDSSYQIATSGGFFQKFQSKTEKKVEIPVSELQDGSTICRSDYIEVEKKGR